MKKILYIFISLLFLSCTKKEVKLPILAEKGIQEIHNHSQVWFFFEIKNNDTIANVNRKNTISTTHWIFNIDKRLLIKKIIPKIIELQDKHANSIHSKEGMHNYFSYSDTVSKKLSFLEFDEVIYKTDSILSKNFIKEYSSNNLNYNNINLTFYKNIVFLNDSKIEKPELKSTLSEFINFSSKGKKTMLHLNFNENIAYQDYIFYKTLIHSLKSETILANPSEFIFNKNKALD